MGKINNLRRHCSSHKALKMGKTLHPDKKMSKRGGGLKDKLIKKRAKPVRKVAKKKTRWTSDAPVVCDWCHTKFSRLVLDFDATWF